MSQVANLGFIEATTSWQGVTALVIFFLTYFLVIVEERIHLPKSKPVMLASGIIWVLVAIAFINQGQSDISKALVKHTLEEYGELFLFLLAAMTFVNVLHERKFFDALRTWLTRKNLTLRQVFWISGFITFFISPIADNLTAALIMCYVILAVGKGQNKFISLSCINIVVAANAGGAFSPFGDITTLMIWQSGILNFSQFFNIFFPALCSYIVPALILSFYVPKDLAQTDGQSVKMEDGAYVVIAIFILTLFSAVGFQVFLNLPPVLGMMSGLGCLGLYSYFLQAAEHLPKLKPRLKSSAPFDLLKIVESAEWDTLLFFYGIILCVSGLGALGYLHFLSDYLYKGIDIGLPAKHTATFANIGIGLISAFLDNIPVVYAILAMKLQMSEGQWLLVTLTAGIGGSLLSIGSAAGVALMGQAKGQYTFFSHLKWSPIILLGYIAGVFVHIWLNGWMF